MAEVIIDIAERFVKEGGEPVDNGLKAVARREDRERAKKVTAFTCFGIEDSDGRGTSIKLELRVEIRQFLLSLLLVTSNTSNKEAGEIIHLTWHY